MILKVLSGLLIWLTYGPVHAVTEVVGVADVPDQQGSQVGMTSSELACLLGKLSWIKKSDAQATGDALANALRLIKFQDQTFSRCALLHFLSQIVVESDSLRTDEQYGQPTVEKKGWAFIQVTGSENLMASTACMEKYAPGRGEQVLAGPAQAIGNKALTRVSSALISLCWWKINMAQNPQNDDLTKSCTPEASQHITEVVNAGGIGRRVTNGMANIHNRQQIFKTLLNEDQKQSCR